MTFYYTNQQSARLMFYHDHAWGITRLNVYAGMAAPYIIQDATEQALVDGGIIPGPEDTIPLVVQDKTFVPERCTARPAGRDLGHRPLGRRGQPVGAACLLAGPEPGRRLGRQRVRPLGLRPLVLAAHERHRSRADRQPLLRSRPVTRT